MTITLNTTSGSTQCLERSDFATTGFLCNAGGKLEPTVVHNPSISGNGSTANPLALALSTDAGQQLVFGTDSKILLTSAVVRGLVSATAPVTYNNSTGVIALNALVNANISASAAIAVTKLAIGNANDVLGTNAGATANEFKTLVVGTAGTAFAIVHTANTITFNLPAASATATGVVNIAAQTFAGLKTFSTIPRVTIGGVSLRIPGILRNSTTVANPAAGTASVSPTVGVSGFAVDGDQFIVEAHGQFTAVVDANKSIEIQVANNAIFTTIYNSGAVATVSTGWVAKITVGRKGATYFASGTITIGGVTTNFYTATPPALLTTVATSVIVIVGGTAAAGVQLDMYNTSQFMN